MEELEARLAAMSPTAACAVDIVQTEVGAKVTEALAVKEGGAQIVFVQNTHPGSLVVHVARNRERALCGWEYAKSRWHEIVSEGGAKRRKCNVCRHAL